MTTAKPEKPAPPNLDQLTDLLGPGIGLWAGLQEAVRAAHVQVTERWVYGGRKYGWSCRLERGKHGIIYMAPDAGYFRVGLALPDAARDAGLPATCRPESEMRWPARRRRSKAGRFECPSGRRMTWQSRRGSSKSSSQLDKPIESSRRSRAD